MSYLFRFKKSFIISVILLELVVFTQNCNAQKFKNLSCPEKWWVIFHPFVAKKAQRITKEARLITQQMKKDTILIGTGNAQQIDAFRHTYWMALLTQEIGWRKAKKLGLAHEKGNYKDYKKHRNEDGVIPDKISSDMDLYNNTVGIEIGKKTNQLGFAEQIILAIKAGKCKIIKMDVSGNYLDCDGNIIAPETLKGKWENNKCLTNSDEVNF